MVVLGGGAASDERGTPAYDIYMHVEMHGGITRVGEDMREPDAYNVEPCTSGVPGTPSVPLSNECD